MFGNQGNNPDPNENPNKNLFGNPLQSSTFPTPPTFTTTDSPATTFAFNAAPTPSRGSFAFSPPTTSRPLFGITRKIDNPRPVTPNTQFGFVPSTATNVFGSKTPSIQGGFTSPISTTSQSPASTSFSPSQINVFGGSTTKTTPVFGSSSISSLFGGHNLTATSSTVTPRTVSSSKSSYAQILKQPIPIFGEKKNLSSSIIKSPSAIQSKKITDRVKTLSRNVLPPKDSTKLHRSDPRTKKLNRPIVSGGLFGQALAGIRQVKPKDSKSSREVKRRLSDGESESVTKPESKEKRVTTAEERSQLNSILCRGVWKEVNTDEFLRNHFSKFGKVTKLYRQVHKETAHVHFQNHDDANNAKVNGTVLVPGQKPILTFWSLSTSVLKKISTETKPQSLKIKPKQEDLTPAVSEETDDELKSMSYNISELEEDLMGREPKEIKVEPPSRKQERVPTPSSTDTPQKHKQGLLDLLRIQTKTSKDRFQVLDTRDKLLRLSRIKQSNITTAKAVVGTCPDMCPEKERYFREEGGRLPIFEVADKGSDSLQLDHTLAVKEYTRSSADQEEPLPHDLRPGPILSMTMDYLVCNIVHAVDQSENSAEWYDFLWNRMRAIRKDITQQHLCDLLSVSLIEKCARFHIHCAERLCEEELKSFDPKINNENLTKCLQTLKHFYHDLGVKGIENPREPEFRGYDILLNLNSSDILRQAQQFTIQVQNSSEVLFAIKVFWAVNSNNYVRFFKLVRAATYLNACIMHRYFNQVRGRALHILTRAYCPSTHLPIHFPMNEFVSMLGFDGPDKASEYCIFHGLSVEGNDIIIDRVNFYHPDTTPAVKRAHTLIENKLSNVIGEVVNGDGLPENPKNSYQLHSSFDSQGYLKPESLTAEDQNPVTDDIDSTEPATVVIKVEVEEFPNSLSDQTDDFSETIVKELANDVMGETTNLMIYKQCKDFVCDVAVIREFALEISDCIANEVTDSFSRDIIDHVFSDAIKEQKLLNEQRMNRENEEREIRAKAILFAQANLENEVVAAEVLQIVMEVVDDAEIEYKAKLLEDSSQTVLYSVISEFIADEVNDITRIVYQTDVVEKRERLEEISRRIRLTKARRFFHLWRRALIRRKRRLKNLKFFPGFPGLLAHNMTAVQVPVGGDHALPMARILQQEKLSRLMDVSVYSSALAKALSCLSLEFDTLLPSMLTDKQNLNRAYCKFVISFPEDDGSVAHKVVRNWLILKFGDENFECCDKIQTLCRWKSKDSAINLCVKSALGILPDNMARDVDNEKQFQGSSAVLFCITKTESEPENFWSEQNSRLEQIGLLHQAYPRPSLCLFIFGFEFPDHYVKSLLEVDLLIRRKLFSSVKIFQTNDITDVSASLNLEHCLKIIMRNSASSLGLCRQPLAEYLDDVISKYFSKMVYDNLSDRITRGLLHQSPEHLISYFNFVVTWAANVVTSPSLRNISWPAPEFVCSENDLPDLQWNALDYLNLLFAEIKGLELAQLPDSRDEDWDVVQDIVWNYICAAVSDVDLKLHTRIETLLLATEKTCERNCCVKYRVAKCSPFWENVPWTEIIHAIIECKLSNMFDAKSSGNDGKFVYYFKEELEEFKPSASWAVAISEKQEKMSPTHLSTLNNSVRKRRLEISSSDSSRFDKKMLTLPPVQEEENDCRNQVDVLLSRIKLEREENSLLNQKLEQSLLDIEEPSFTSTPRVKSNRKRARPETDNTPIMDKINNLKSYVESEATFQKMMAIKLKNLSTI